MPQAAEHHKTNYAALFDAWKTEHGKEYSSAYAETKAFRAFAHNEEKIAAHNALGLSYTLGHNEYSDLTADEFFAGRLGFNATAAHRPAGNLHVTPPDFVAPDAVDWVAKGAVTPVKNQGQCGSCWSFSATGSMEGAYQIASGKLVSLSEEVLVQCDTTNDDGCQGGLMDNAFKFAETHGITADSDYPYTSGTGIRGLCQPKKEATPAIHVTGFKDVPSGDEASLLSAVSQQPVSIAIEADQSAFQLYKTGVLDSPFCGTNLDHGVLLVGFGTEGKDYWKVKNSWGASWGESGYIRMVRGKNMCGLASQASYPTGAAAGAPSMVEA